MAVLVIPSPVGLLYLTAGAEGLTRLAIGAAPANPSDDADPILATAAAQLSEWFQGRRVAFDLPLAPGGTLFQRRVWAALCAIPFGATESYGRIATGLDSGPRAVAGACARNPLPIVIPCHRVVGAAGLGGYSGGQGLATKRALLDHEAAHRAADSRCGRLPALDATPALAES